MIDFRTEGRTCEAAVLLLRKIIRVWSTSYSRMVDLIHNPLPKVLTLNDRDIRKSSFKYLFLCCNKERHSICLEIGGEPEEDF